MSPTHAYGRLRWVPFFFCRFYQTGTESIRTYKTWAEGRVFSKWIMSFSQNIFFFTYRIVINFNSWLDEWNMRHDGSSCSAKITCCLIFAIGLIRQKFCIWTCLLYCSMAGIITEVYKLSKKRPNPLVKLTKVSGWSFVSWTVHACYPVFEHGFVFVKRLELKSVKYVNFNLTAKGVCLGLVWTVGFFELYPNCLLQSFRR